MYIILPINEQVSKHCSTDHTLKSVSNSHLEHSSAFETFQSNGQLSEQYCTQETLQKSKHSSANAVQAISSAHRSSNTSNTNGQLPRHHRDFQTVQQRTKYFLKVRYRYVCRNNCLKPSGTLSPCGFHIGRGKWISRGQTAIYSSLCARRSHRGKSGRQSAMSRGWPTVNYSAPPTGNCSKLTNR